MRMLGQIRNKPFSPNGENGLSRKNPTAIFLSGIENYSLFAFPKATLTLKALDLMGLKRKKGGKYGYRQTRYTFPQE